jgi:acyl-CoA synthetase (AMP-forming)/AMP-acid ligase II
MSLVMEALDTPEAERSRLHCLADGSDALTLSELGRRSRRAGARLEGLAGPGGAVAALLSASHDCLAALFGALRSGLTLVSLPHPARGMAGAEYLAQIRDMCALTGAEHLLCEPALRPLLQDGTGVAVHGYGDLGAHHRMNGGDTPGRLVQFTSGSTSSPRGVALTLDALDANLDSMYGWLAPAPGAVVCSWLPLSHDMGLIGLALYGLCSVSPPWSTPTDVVLMTPEWFLADPDRWMAACTEYRATSTTSPPFALRLAARTLRSASRSYDLSSIRSFVVGSEPIPAESLRSFGVVAEPFGLSPHALCPGYGMAEATVAVAIGGTLEPWSSLRVETDALAREEWAESPDGGTEVVSCGPPVPGVEVRVAGGAPLGELEIKGPSLLDHYVGDPRAPLTPDGWFHTADLGSLRAAEVYVVGRTDDVFVVAGRNLDARALDDLVGRHPGCRPGNAACIPDGEGRFVVVAEPDSAVADAAALRGVARDMRVSLVRRFSAGPSSVVFIERGTLPKTPSGKVRRNHLRALWAEGKLAQICAG